MLLALFRDTVHSYSRHGVVAAKLVSGRPGGVLKIQKIFILSRLHSWLQSLRLYLGAFEKLRKAKLASSCLPVCMSVRPSSLMKQPGSH